MKKFIHLDTHFYLLQWIITFEIKIKKIRKAHNRLTNNFHNIFFIWTRATEAACGWLVSVQLIIQGTDHYSQKTWQFPSVSKPIYWLQLRVSMHGPILCANPVGRYEPVNKNTVCYFLQTSGLLDHEEGQLKKRTTLLWLWNET